MISGGKILYYNHCTNCPYFNQKHLIRYKTKRVNPHIGLEDNGSSTLLVFLAPGIEEWKIGKAIQPITKKGGSAGKRIQNSWERTKKNRNDFDIINAVQCFPGNNGGRDLPPDAQAIEICSSILDKIIKNKHYAEIITFGKLPRDTIEKIALEDANVLNMRHPSGGLNNGDLDEVWKDDIIR